MKKITLLFSLIVTACFVKAQASPAWFKTTGPAAYANYDLKEVSTAVDTLGNVYTAASMYDSIANDYRLLLVKYNGSGAQQWLKTYSAGVDKGAYVVSLLVDKSGNSYVCGYGANTGSNDDYMVTKYDNSGSQIWVKYWDGGQTEDDEPICATFDKAGNIVVAGRANKFGTNGEDIAIVKWSPAGAELWSYVYNNTSTNGEDRPLSITTDTNNNVFVTGSTYSVTSRCIITIKLNSSGVNQWTKIKTNTSGGDDERGRSIAADAAGNVYITTAADEWETIKYSSTGTQLWSNIFNPGSLNRDNEKKIMIDKFGQIVVTGDAFYGGGVFTNYAAFKLNPSDGSNLWTINYNNAGIDAFYDAALDTAGNIYMCGKYDGPQGGDMASMIVSPSGIVLWNTVFTNPNKAAGDDRPYQMVLDKDKNIFMAGLSETRGAGSTDAVDVITLKYSTIITGINEKTKETILIGLYPNPSKGILNVSISDPQLIGATITVCNVTGQEISSEKINSQNQVINLEKQAKGIYFITLHSSNGNVTKKLILE